MLECQDESDRYGEPTFRVFERLEDGDSLLVGEDASTEAGAWRSVAEEFYDALKRVRQVVDGF